MSGYVLPRPDLETLKGKVDPNGGFLCITAHWQPDTAADDPDMPGRKVQMCSYIPVPPHEPCLCGSGERYGDCCQRGRLWHPICPNPGDPSLTYSLLQPQVARLPRVNGAATRPLLMADPRLYCTEDGPQRGFWILFGDPVLEDPYGVICFGDIELKRNRTLIVSAMSDLRMQALLTVLQEILGDLPEARIDREDIPVLDKRTGKSRMLRPARSPSSRQGKRRRR